MINCPCIKKVVSFWLVTKSQKPGSDWSWSFWQNGGDNSSRRKRWRQDCGWRRKQRQQMFHWMQSAKAAGFEIEKFIEAKSICSGVMIFYALQEPDVVYCMKLERYRSPLPRLEESRCIQYNGGNPWRGTSQMLRIPFNPSITGSISGFGVIILMDDMLSCNSQAANQKIIASTLFSISSFLLGFPLVHAFPLMICVITFFFLPNCYFYNWIIWGKCICG